MERPLNCRPGNKMGKGFGKLTFNQYQFQYQSIEDIHLDLHIFCRIMLHQFHTSWQGGGVGSGGKEFS